MTAQSYFNQGVESAHKGDLLQSVHFFRQAIALNPAYAEAYNGLGALLINMNNLNEAEGYLHQAIELKADYPEALYNLGTVFARINLLDEAEVCLCETINLMPDFPEAHFRLGMIFKQKNRLKDAEAHLCRAIELQPNFKEADFALGILYLLQGQYDKGWKRYELRRQIFDSCEPEINRWQVENLVGCKILLYHEQGFGDTIHFVRYIEEIAKVASKTVVLVPKPLERLLSTSLSDITIQVDNNVVGEYDFSCPLPSLPFMFNTTLHTIPQSVPYIKTSYHIIKKWHDLLEKTISDKYKVGVVWAGNPNHKNDRNRSIPFELFKQILSISTVSWISLQVDQRAADLKTLSPGKVTDFYDNLSDFAESAGLIENINLVITVDTAVAHLAGAMGKETWLLLPIDPDWRWLATGQDSLWYPTIRIFRQRHIGDWQEVLERVKVTLEAKLKGNQPAKYF
jgi:hypothetical protein